MADPARALEAVAHDAASCTNCELYRRATQTVFGEGPVPAPLMLVGEQPGDQEDLAGRPFVGSAGRVLDEALDEVGLERSRVYVTNAVKHFKWKQRGKRRLHQRPNAGEVAACSPWLVHEIEKVDPRIVVAMGVTALRSMFTGRVTIRAMRGRIETSRFGVPAVVTVHPAAIVRLREREERHAAFEAFVADLRTASDAAKVVEHR